MSLVWIDCLRRLKKEAQDVAKEEEEKSMKLKEIEQKKLKNKRVVKIRTNNKRKVSFNAVIHVSYFTLITLLQADYSTFELLFLD